MGEDRYISLGGILSRVAAYTVAIKRGYTVINIFLSTCRNFGWRDGEIWIGLQAPSPITCSCTAECGDDNCQACLNCRQNFTWLDGSNAQYRNWIDAEPSIDDIPSDEKAGVVLTENGGWRAKPVQNLLRYICEKGDNVPITLFFVHYLNLSMCTQVPCFHYLYFV